MNKIKDINMALTIFEEATLEHTKATEEGDFKTGNVNFERIVTATNFLKEKKAIYYLKKFITHDSIGVQMWAASYLLATKDKESVKILKKIIKTDTIHSFTAETTLNEWKNGNLNL